MTINFQSIHTVILENMRRKLVNYRAHDLMERDRVLWKGKAGKLIFDLTDLVGRFSNSAVKTNQHIKEINIKNNEGSRELNLDLIISES